MTVFSSCTVEVEWTAGVWTDLTSRLRMPVSIRRGRATQFEDVGAGVFKAQFDNHDGALMPDNYGSPYWPNVTDNIRLRFKLTKSAVTYTRFFGWIQTYEPDFADGDLASSRVTITAVDALGLLAQKKLHSSWSELALYAGRRDGTVIDAYEGFGLVAGQYLYITNVSNEVGAPQGFAVNNGGAPPLTFGSDDIITGGPTIVASPDSSDHTCYTKAVLQNTAPLNIQLMFKAPSSHVSNTGTNYTLATLSDGSATRLFNVCVHDNGAGANEIRVLNAAFTVNLATIGPIAYGRWYMLAMTQNAGTATSTDFQAWDEVGSAVGGPGPTVAVDIRNVRNVEVPGAQGNTMPLSYAGIVATRTRTQIPKEMAFAAGNTTLTQRMTDLANACGLMPIAFTQVGDWSALGCTGRDWYGRWALDVASEIVRSTRNTATGTGIMFARPRDSQVLAIAGDQTRPATPLVTIECEADMLSGLKMAAGVDALPTRVNVQSPQTTATAQDSAAIAAGQDRSATVSTINRGGFSDADDIATLWLNRYEGLRFGKLKIDLMGPVNDPTAALFDESGTNTGLFPTARVRFADLPPTHFSAPTRDGFIEGWEEIYNDDAAWIEADTSPAQLTTLASDFFPGTSGGWSSQWVAGTGSASYTLSANQGLVTPQAAANSYGSRRLNVAARADGDLTGAVILNNAASFAYIWVRGNSTLATSGYTFDLSCSGILSVSRWVGGVRTGLLGVFKNLTAGTEYGWRLRVIGKYINARVWDWSGDEQKTWDIALTDTTVTGTGYAGIAVLNDATTTPRTVTFDDIVYTDGAVLEPVLL